MPVPYLFSLLGTSFLVKKYGTVPFFFILILILRYASCHLRAPQPHEEVQDEEEHGTQRKRYGTALFGIVLGALLRIRDPVPF